MPTNLVNSLSVMLSQVGHKNRTLILPEALLRGRISSAEAKIVFRKKIKVNTFMHFTYYVFFIALISVVSFKIFLNVFNVYLFTL